MYDDDYATHVGVIRDEVERVYPNLHLVGRNGMHKYDNQDHAMMTAMLCAKNILAGGNVYDVWLVNQDAEYHEVGRAEQKTGAGVHVVSSARAGTLGAHTAPDLELAGMNSCALL